uniref:Uncharacterized protein n=1 Tax=Bursaphelenchus xylophilus TaxID=6326 RepID=A0A1E1ERV7_BURXY|nr:hypothetical protein BUX.s01281.242 [Bursaphelenchus xylophilus]
MSQNRDSNESPRATTKNNLIKDPLDCRRKPLSSTILIVPTTDDGVAFVRNQRIPHALVVVWQAPINYDSLCRNEPTIFGRFHVHMANPHKK